MKDVRCTEPVLTPQNEEWELSANDDDNYYDTSDDTSEPGTAGDTTYIDIPLALSLPPVDQVKQYIKRSKQTQIVEKSHSGNTNLAKYVEIANKNNITDLLSKTRNINVTGKRLRSPIKVNTSASNGDLNPDKVTLTSETHKEGRPLKSTSDGSLNSSNISQTSIIVPTYGGTHNGGGTFSASILNKNNTTTVLDTDECGEPATGGTGAVGATKGLVEYHFQNKNENIQSTEMTDIDNTLPDINVNTQESFPGLNPHINKQNSIIDETSDEETQIRTGNRKK